MKKAAFAGIWTVLTPGLPSFIRAVVSVDGNTVKVRFSSLGMSIIFK